jgi:hypothetical protein
MVKSLKEDLRLDENAEITSKRQILAALVAGAKV